jgi:hypothetical protein
MTAYHFPLEASCSVRVATEGWLQDLAGRRGSGTEGGMNPHLGFIPTLRRGAGSWRRHCSLVALFSENTLAFLFRAFALF